MIFSREGGVVLLVTARASCIVGALAGAAILAGCAGTANNASPMAGAMQQIEGAFWIEAPIDRSQNVACTSTIPRSAMAHTTVYLGIQNTRDSPSAAARPFASALTAAIARRVRTTLGTGDAMPSGEPHVTWQGASGAIRLSVHPDGRVDRPEPEADPVLGAGVRTVVSALDALIDAREMPPWPTGLRDSTISFTMHLFTPMVGRSGRAWGDRPQLVEPLFDVRQPSMEPVTHSGTDFPRYPVDARLAGVMARFEFAYTVDTAGSVDMRTVTLRKDRPLLSRGNYLEQRRAFLESILAFLGRARFQPARIGDCPVRQRLEQAYEFRLEY